MAKTQDKLETAATATGPQTQRERWVRYGGNVVLSTFLVVAIGVSIIYLATRSSKRIDMTGSGLYSLKPQTVNIIKDLDQPVEIISLYSTEVQQSELVRRTVSREQRRDWEQEVRSQAERVQDLLEEYASKGRTITAQAIDPVRQEGKVNELIQRVASKYGGEVARYRDYIEQYNQFARKLTDTAAVQTVKVQGLPVEQMQQSPDQNLQRAAMAVAFMRDGLSGMFDNVDRSVEKRVQESPPDFKGAADAITDALDQFGQYAASFTQIAEQQSGQTAVPEPVRQYLGESVGVIKALQDEAAKLREAGNGLGDLKLDSFRESLNRRNTILVLGQDDMRVLDYDTIWQTDARDAAVGQTELKPRFAGEQQVTSAILSLTRKQKPKIAFVRNGGSPLTDPGFPPFQPSGPLSMLAQRLREYNFEVLEKDLSNMWAMQAQMRGQPAPPEPTDEQIKDAIWIAINSPGSMGGPMGGMPTTISPQLMEHVNNGGSAMVMFVPRSANLEEFLDAWGVKARPDTVATHAGVELTRPNDFAEAAKANPFGFVPNRYEAHPITDPMQSLDTLLFLSVALQQKEAEPPAGVTVSPLIKLPPSPLAWGESDPEGEGELTYDAMNDVGGQLLGAVALEKENGPRLVVLPSIFMATNDVLSVPDMALRDQGVRAARFPGNMELLLNSVFWMAKMETMMAISPSAMDVSRISGLSEPARRAWGVGVLWGGLPMAVIAAGVMVYLARRD